MAGVETLVSLRGVGAKMSERDQEIRGIMGVIHLLN